MADQLRPAPPPTDSDESIASLLNSLRQLVNAMYSASRDAQHSHGVTAAQLFILSHVRRSSNLSIGALAELTMTHQSTVSVVVRRLVRRKLLEKRRAADDARRVELTLTPAGRKVVESSPEAFQLRLQHVLATLDAADRAALSRALARLIAGIGAGAAPSGMFFESIDE
jgi:DNA-binding MarR family transcriptional regulator